MTLRAKCGPRATVWHRCHKCLGQFVVWWEIEDFLSEKGGKRDSRLEMTLFRMLISSLGLTSMSCCVETHTHTHTQQLFFSTGEAQPAQWVTADLNMWLILKWMFQSYFSFQNKKKKNTSVTSINQFNSNCCSAWAHSISTIQVSPPPKFLNIKLMKQMIKMINFVVTLQWRYNVFAWFLTESTGESCSLMYHIELQPPRARGQ